MQSERIAVIDLGTNTFHLLIAEVEENKSKTIYSEKASVRIGKGGINQGFISEDACARALATMMIFKDKINEYSITKIYATATSAFRNASNGIALAEKIYASTGIKISIISGDREAELIYYGVKEALDLGHEKSLIVDIGGGSVEFIIANKDSVFWKKSFEIGGQRLMEFFQKTDPIAPEDIKNLESYLLEQLLPLQTALVAFPTQTLIGSSGSFDTFSDIDLRKKGHSFSIETKKEYQLALNDFEQLYLELISKERAARNLIPGMIELRVDMIVVASVLVNFLLTRFEINLFRVSSFALKEGVLSRIMRGENID